MPGWRTKRKIVVIESDDWGSIRMPSRAVYEHLLNKGYKVNTDPYLKYDSLASEQDLSDLFEVLQSVKDKNGNPAVITANCVVANPDFVKIRNSDFNEYHYELFTETLKRFPKHANSFNLWKEGMSIGVFHPQFHGREHLNVDRWMKALQKNDRMLREAFDLNMISISSEPSDMRFAYMESLDFFSHEERESKAAILRDGLEKFKSIFGYNSDSFIANCYIWNIENENTLWANGVKFIQGVSIQKSPNIDSRHRYILKYHYLGQRGRNSQIYLARNAFFEPSHFPNNDNIEECLKRIDVAFQWNKPAIISIHRLNFIGNINSENSQVNLILFKRLLIDILKRWSDVEFLTSDKLGRLISNK